MLGVIVGEDSLLWRVSSQCPFSSVPYIHQNRLGLIYLKNTTPHVDIVFVCSFFFCSSFFLLSFLTLNTMKIHRANVTAIYISCK